MKPILFVTLLFLWIPAIAGIYRHDVPLEKYTALANHKDFDCVGQVYLQEDTLRFKSSCVLIDEQYILGAAHEFKYGKGLDLSTYRFAFKGKYYKAESITFFRQGDITYDLVLIKLDKPITDIPPAMINTGINELNTKATCVGYGSVRNGMMYNGREHLDYKMAGNNIIDSIGGETYKGQATLLMADFDHPELKKLNVCGTAECLPLEYMANGGDSGGGLFMKKGDRYTLIGITKGASSTISTATGQYGSVSKWLRLSLFADWINEKMKEG